MDSLSILNTEIRIHDGLYSLNDLHKASGGMEKHAPNRWLRSEQTKALIEEIKRTPDLAFDPIRVLKGGNVQLQGTYACKELVYAYAMWISARFHLTVIRAFDALATGQASPVAQTSPYPIPQTLPEALRLAAEALEERDALKPKAEALERIARSDGLLCLTDAAKTLQVSPRVLIGWLAHNRWIYRRKGDRGNWVGFQPRINQGWLHHKTVMLDNADGSQREVISQVQLTPLGLSVLAQRLGRGAQLALPMAEPPYRSAWARAGGRAGREALGQPPEIRFDAESDEEAALSAFPGRHLGARP